MPFSALSDGWLAKASHNGCGAPLAGSRIVDRGIVGNCEEFNGGMVVGITIHGEAHDVGAGIGEGERATCVIGMAPSSSSSVIPP